MGLNTPGGRRNDLSRDFDNPQFFHFATDIEGKRLITDCGPLNESASVWCAEFGEPGQDALLNWRYLVTARCTCQKSTHLHPFLSPDGRLGSSTPTRAASCRRT